MYAPPRVFHSLLFYAIVMSAIVVYRPELLFDRESGEPIPFGVGRGKTVFDLGTTAAVTAVLSFALFTFVDVIAPT